MQFQSLALEGTGRIWGLNNVGLVLLSHILGNNNSTSIFPFQCGMGNWTLYGSRFNPYTYAPESANTNSQVGISSFIQQFGVVSVVPARLTILTISQSYIVSGPFTDNKSTFINQGTRCGAVNLFSCGQAHGSTLFGGITTTTGYARTRFTGIEIQVNLSPYLTNAGLMLINSSIFLGGGVDFTTLPKVDIGLELHRSHVWCSLNNSQLLGVASKIGMYIHTGSAYVQSLFATAMPKIRGKTVGDVSCDRLTRKTTWEAAWVADVTDATQLSMIKKGYISLY